MKLGENDLWVLRFKGNEELDKSIIQYRTTEVREFGKSIEITFFDRPDSPLGSLLSGLIYLKELSVELYTKGRELVRTENYSGLKFLSLVKMSDEGELYKITFGYEKRSKDFFS